MDISRIRRMAQRGTLEVEHLLRLASKPSEELATELANLALELKWETRAADDCVPFGEWAAVVQHFCRTGYDGLAAYADEPRKFDFIVGLLEELRGQEALRCLETLLAGHKAMLANDQARSGKLAGAFNLLGRTMNGHDGGNPVQDIHALRDFLHAQLQSQDEPVRGAAMCALRYFGDGRSLDLVRAAPPMSTHWEPARSAAVRGIKKRLRLAAPAS